MKLIRKMTTTVAASLDAAAGRFEHHEAIVDAALRRARSASSQAKVRLNRVRQDRQRLEQACESHREAVDKWAARAKQVATYNQGKALECVKRRNQQQAQLAQAQRDLAELDERLKGLQAVVQRADQQITELTRQRNVLSTREAASRAHKGVENLVCAERCDIQDVLERWESKVMTAEYDLPDAVSETDALTSEFEDAEQAERLAADLAQLLEED